VSIPSGIEPAAAVRCPLCDGEYALDEALALVPPELIPVSAGPSTAESPTDEGIDQAADADEPASEPRADDAADAEQTDIPQPVEGAELADPHEGANEATAAAGGAPAMPSAALKRRSRSTSGLRRLVETLIGALVGFVIAYYGWALWLGQQRFQEEVIQRFGLPRLPFISSSSERPAK
jgi:hypothetical protein